MKSLDTQIGGSHYTGLKIQPMEYSMANNLDACQHSIVKYITRFRDKGGVSDLKKAKHVIDMLIEFEDSAKNSGRMPPNEDGAAYFALAGEAAYVDRMSDREGRDDVSEHDDDAGWKPWDGSNPYGPRLTESPVEIKFRSGLVRAGCIYEFPWRHNNTDADIIAYRIVK